MIQWIKELVYGKAAKGEYINKPCGYHTTLPDITVPMTQMHTVIHKTIEDIHKKLGDHN